MNNKNQSTKISVISNELVNIVTHDFTPVDLDIFEFCCYLAKDKGTKPISITYSDIKRIAFSKNITTKELYEKINLLADKLGRCQVFQENASQTHTSIFTVFQGFENDLNTQTLDIQVSEKWAYTLNKLTKNFTRLELDTYFSLKKKTSKLLYKHLSQYRTTGMWRCSVEDFRVLFDVPDSQSDNKILEKQIKPAVNELNPFFKKLEYTILKENRKTIGFEFNFKFQDKIQPLEEVNPMAIPPEVKAVKEIQKNKTQAPKTRFHNFEQREYSDEFYDDLERRLRMK